MNARVEMFARVRDSIDQNESCAWHKSLTHGIEESKLSLTFGLKDVMTIPLHRAISKRNDAPIREDMVKS